MQGKNGNTDKPTNEVYKKRAKANLGQHQILNLIAFKIEFADGACH